MALRDILAGEDSDNRKAAEAASQGRSITGLSGRHTDMGDRFAPGREALFGGRVGSDTAADNAEAARPRQEPPSPSTSVFDPIIPWDAPARRTGEVAQAQRKPFGDSEQQLAYPERPGYRRYWANDRPGRIKRFIQAGYAHVVDDETGEVVARNTDVIDGHGRKSYLMEIPIQWYQEDMAKNAARLADRLNDIRTGRHGPGSEDPTRYVPRQGISIQGR